MAVLIVKACPGLKKRTGALISGLTALLLAACLLVDAILCMVYTYRDSIVSGGSLTPIQKQMTQCYIAAGFAIFGVYAMLTMIMIFGIFVENKRALGFWLIYVFILPIYLVAGLIFIFAGVKHASGWIISYLLVQGVNVLASVWICLAVWVFFIDVRERDKNPELRVDEFVRRKENELMFAQPFMGVMPPAGSYNPGYGAPSGGSMSSIPRSQKSRHTYAPTETGGSVRAAPTGPRQSRLDQYKAQHAEKGDRSRSRSGEREGGPTYYRYQYTADQKANDSFHGSQGSLGGRPAGAPPPSHYDPPQYQAARYMRPAQSSQGQMHGSQGSLGGRQPYQPPAQQPYQPQAQQPYQPQAQHHASQGSLGRAAYVPRHHASQGSLGGRPQYELQAQDNQYSKDSEV